MPWTPCRLCGAGEAQSLVDAREGHAVCTSCGCVYPQIVLVHEGYHASQRSCLAAAHVGDLRSRDSAQRSLAYAGRRTISCTEQRRVRIDSAIDELGDRLDMTERLRDEAKRVAVEIRRVHQRKVKKDELLAATCYAIACRRLHLPRSFGELARRCPTVDAKELGRAFKTLSRALGGAQAQDGFRRLVPGFASKLRMDGRTALLCERIARHVHSAGLVPGRNPLSCVAGTLRFVGRHTDAQVARVVGVAPNTVRKAHRVIADDATAVALRGRAEKGGRVDALELSNS